jgi:hypothetical protein
VCYQLEGDGSELCAHFANIELPYWFDCDPRAFHLSSRLLCHTLAYIFGEKEDPRLLCRRNCFCGFAARGHHVFVIVRVVVRLRLC